MLQQIGQDMTMTEQQLRVHNMQSKKTVRLKRVMKKLDDANSIDSSLLMFIRSFNRFYLNIKQLTNETYLKQWRSCQTLKNLLKI